MADRYLLPRRLDDPELIGLWTIDEFLGLIIPFAWGILAQHIFLGIAFIGFLLVKVLPLYESSPTHESGRISISKKGDGGQTEIPTDVGVAWILNKNGDTLVEVAIEISNSVAQIKKGLTNRANLDTGTGMLYIFPNSDHDFATLSGKLHSI